MFSSSPDFFSVKCKWKMSSNASGAKNTFWKVLTQISTTTGGLIIWIIHFGFQGRAQKYQLGDRLETPM